MYDLIVSVLVWLSASPTEVDIVAPRASSCASAAYVSMLREPIEEQEAEVEPEVEPEDTAGGGTPPASTKKRVVRCVNGRCYITYE
jgi:hypothetical protein